MIEQTSLTLLSGGFYHCTPAWDKPADGLDQCYKIYLPTAGEAFVVVGGEPCRLQPGGFYFISGYRIERQYCPAGMDHHWIHFVPDSIYLSYLLTQAKPFYRWSTKSFDFWRQTIDEFPRIFEHPDADRNRPDENAPPASYYRVQAMIFYFISDLLGQCNVGDPYRSDPTLQRLRPAIEMMDQRYIEAPSLEEIADSVHLAPNYFHRKFTEVFHVTPFEYMLRKRMNAARQLLAFSEMSVKEVASRVGYDNPFYFSRLFTKYFGLSPSQMRKKAAIG
jgi:AraC-like DNA-binding protein